MKFWFHNPVNSCLYSLVQVVQRKLLNGSDPYSMLQWTQWCTFSILQLQNGSLWGASLLSLLHINKIRIRYKSLNRRSINMSTFLLENVYNFSSICLPLLDSSSFSGWRAKASCCTIYIQNTSGRLSREVSSELSIHVNAMTSDVIAPSSWKIFGCQNGKCDFFFFSLLSKYLCIVLQFWCFRILFRPEAL